MLITAITGGIAVGCALLLPWAMLPDVMELDELQTGGQRREGLFYSFFVFFQKVGLGVGLALSAVMLGAAGFRSPETNEREGLPADYQPDSVLWTLRISCGPVPAGLILLSIVTVYLFPITRTRHRETTQAVRQLRDQNRIDLECQQEQIKKKQQQEQELEEQAEQERREREQGENEGNRTGEKRKGGDIEMVHSGNLSRTMTGDEDEEEEEGNNQRRYSYDSHPHNVNSTNNSSNRIKKKKNKRNTSVDLSRIIDELPADVQQDIHRMRFSSSSASTSSNINNNNNSSSASIGLSSSSQMNSNSELMQHQHQHHHQLEESGDYFLDAVHEDLRSSLPSSPSLSPSPSLTSLSSLANSNSSLLPHSNNNSNNHSPPHNNQSTTSSSSSYSGSTSPISAHGSVRNSGINTAPLIQRQASSNSSDEEDEAMEDVDL